MDQFSPAEKGSGMIFATDSFQFAGYTMRLSCEAECPARARQWLDIAQARLITEIKHQTCIAPQLRKNA